MTAGTTRLNYIIGAETWYAPLLDREEPGRELRIGRDSYRPDGTDDGCVWEFTIVTHSLGASTALRVEAFDDAWAAFADVPDLFARLATMSNHEAANHDRQWTLADVVAVLDDLGFTDDTPRERR